MERHRYDARHIEHNCSLFKFALILAWFLFMLSGSQKPAPFTFLLWSSAGFCLSPLGSSLGCHLKVPVSLSCCGTGWLGLFKGVACLCFQTLLTFRKCQSGVFFYGYSPGSAPTSVFPMSSPRSLHCAKKSDH